MKTGDIIKSLLYGSIITYLFMAFIDFELFSMFESSEGRSLFLIFSILISGFISLYYIPGDYD